MLGLRSFLPAGTWLLIFALLRLVSEQGTDRFQKRLLLAQDALGSAGLAFLLVCLAKGWFLHRQARCPVNCTHAFHRWRMLVPLWGLVALPWVGWFIGEWPGHFFSDQTRTVVVALQRGVEPWLSTFWGVWAGGLLRWTGNFTAVSVFNIALLSFLIADIVSLLMFAGLSRKLVCPFVLWVMVSIPLGLLVINLSHDVLTAVLKLAIIDLFLRSSFRREDFNPLLLGALVLFAVWLRGENVVLLVTVPALLMLRGWVPFRRAAILALTLIAIHGLYKTSLEPGLATPLIRDPLYRAKYELVLMANPLSFLLVNGYDTPTADEDEKIISQVIDPVCLRNNRNVYEPPCYWTGTRDFTADQMNAFRRMFQRAVLHNWGLFLANRVAVFFGNLGFESRGIYPFIYKREDWTDEMLYGPSREIIQKQGLIFQRSHISFWSRLTHGLRDASHPREGAIGRWIWNLTPAVLFLLVLATQWKRRPVGSTVAWFLLGPFCLFFIAAPAVHLTYLADLWIFGYLAIPLFFFHPKQLKPT